ncbi:MAG: hypothetical protein IJ106_02130 [Parasporobacterium sp.]|nr:hypothetical protein [Parasporobacterium sp.]
MLRSEYSLIAKQSFNQITWDGAAEDFQTLEDGSFDLKKYEKNCYIEFQDSVTAFLKKVLYGRIIFVKAQTHDRHML